MLESTLQKKIKTALITQLGAVVYKTNADAHRGFPDLVVVAPHGVVCFLEIKTATGVISPLQARMIQQLNDRGANAKVCRSVDEALSYVKSKSRKRR